MSTQVTRFLATAAVVLGANAVFAAAPARPVFQLPLFGGEDLHALAHMGDELEAARVRHQVQEGVDELGGLAALDLRPQYGGGL